MATVNPTSEIGKKYGRWTVVAFSHTGERNRRFWLCRCQCGTERAVIGTTLTCGRSRSCGCIAADFLTKHGFCRVACVSPAWRTWSAMIQRCYNPRNNEFANYGGRGIAVCERWRDAFTNFLSDMGEKPPGLSIERIDNNGNYEPGNCRWATQKEQSRNMRKNVFFSYGGTSLIIQDWSEKTGIKTGTISKRLSRGWTFDKAITTPVDTRCHHMRA